MEALERGGADLIELGVPFSDPIADGPVIQRAAERALQAGTTLAQVLEIAREIRSAVRVPLLLFTYLNPVLRYGLTQLAARRGGCGHRRLPADRCERGRSGARTSAPCARTAWTPCFWPRPPARERRLELVAQYSTGFVYLVSRTGVTGEQASLSESAAPLIERMRKVTDLPLAVGFGISKPEHVAEVGRAGGRRGGGQRHRAHDREACDDPRSGSKLEAFTRDLKHGLGTEARDDTGSRAGQARRMPRTIDRIDRAAARAAERAHARGRR